ncbi:MAG: UvrD-helicase domain-containing protein [Deltaproteobacteria bacterium]|nr:UvrD-helicase domain-containing protein [Deltaproteobacteria bacterium]
MTRMLDPLSPRTRVATAPAGSGKTTLLLRHYLRHLAGTSADRIVAITFTRKAAAELADRLAGVLRAIADPKAPRDALTDLCLPTKVTQEQALRSLAMLDAAPVCTVDAFALGLVQEFALEAHFRLRDGTKVWIDGPIQPGGDPVPSYEAAAREQLETLSPAAKVLLRELNVGQAIADVAKLARTGVPALWDALACTPGKPGTLPSLDDLLAALGKAFAPAARQYATELQTSLAASTAVEPHRAAVEAWLRKPGSPPPLALLHFVVKIRKTKEANILHDAFVAALARAMDDLGLPAEEALVWDVWDAWRDKSPLAPWCDEAARERSAAHRQALCELALAARDGALRALARNGRLGFDELLLAATSLCLQPPEALAARYDVLMVDELQDTNPAQLGFYRAFEAMKRPGKPAQAFFVGDARQSIYRFRDADPFGWKTLVKEADEAGASADLDRNYRSSKPLVEVQKKLFLALGRLGLRGVDPLGDLRAADGATDGPVKDAKWPTPLVVIDAAAKGVVPDDECIRAFAERLTARWAKHRDESAAVIVRSWAMGAWAAQQLRSYEVDAQLWGDRTLLSSRVAVDLRLLLGTLLDVSEELALVGLLKHPSIGVSDRGLLLLRHGGSLGRLFGPAVDLSALEKADGERLAAALEVLRDGRRRLGREPTAEVLERVVSRLAWRPIVAAGPEHDDGVALAQLDILLDVVRDAEADGVDPRSVLERLTPIDDPAAAAATDLPLVRLHGRRKVVVVTTTFGAKGLEFDHVALLQLDGDSGSSGVRSGKSYALAMPQGRLLLGVSLDPTGGLQPCRDPLALMGSALCGREKDEECLRMFYVGLTRAKTTVTFALGKPPKNGKAFVGALRTALLPAPPPPAEPPPAEPPPKGKAKGKKAAAQEQDAVLAAALKDLEADVTALVVDAPTTTVPARKVRERTARKAELKRPWNEEPGRRIARPSSAADFGIDATTAEAAFRKGAKLVLGAAAPKRPAVAGLDGVEPSTWGDVVHGWFAQWQFAAGPKVEDAASYLERRWETKSPALARWLVDLGLAVRDGLPGFSELLGHKLHFEWPMVGLDDGLAKKVVWAGRADLVVELPGKKLIVIDFKAGDSAATSLADIPHLSTYAPQLEAYRRVLTAAGYTVAEVGLLYVSGVSWVRTVSRP